MDDQRGAGTETVLDADTGNVRATVPMGGEVGVVYDPTTDAMVVAVQGRGDLAVITPDTFTITDRIPAPGRDGPRGEALDTVGQLMSVGCEDNATLVTVDLATRTIVDHNSVGQTPDVLAYSRRCHPAGDR